MIPLYGMMIATMQLGPNEDRMDHIRYGLAEHYRVFGTLPCPAPLDASPDDADYAKGSLAAGNCTGVIDGGNVWIGALPITDLAGVMDCLRGDDRIDYIAALPPDLQGVLQKDISQINGIRYASTLNRTDYDDKQWNAIVDKDSLARAGCVTHDLLLDQYGNKMVYAVAKDAVDFGTFDPTTPLANGVVINDKNGNPLTADPQWFALISMGPDGKGSYNANGDQVINCSAAALDGENCDGDSVFIAAPFASIAGSGHFDDSVDYSLDHAMTEHSFWYWQSSTVPAARDIRFQPQRRLIVMDAAMPVTINADDALIVTGGNMAVNAGAAAGTGGVVAEGDINADQNLTAGGDITAVDAVTGGVFCYSNRPPAMPVPAGCPP